MGYFRQGAWIEFPPAIHPWKPGDPVISTGEPSTLKTYYNISRVLGVNTVSDMLYEKMKTQGEDELVVADEIQMMLLIGYHIVKEHEVHHE